MAIKKTIFIEQGTDFAEDITLTDNDGVALDLTSKSVVGYLRKSLGSINFVEFIIDINDAATGDITLRLDATVTATIVGGISVYDVISRDAQTFANPTKVLEGQAQVDGTATNVYTPEMLLVIGPEGPQGPDGEDLTTAGPLNVRSDNGITITLTDEDYYVVATNAAGAAISLPPVDSNIQQVFEIKNAGEADASIESVVNIDGSSDSFPLSEWEVIKVLASGGNWLVFSRYVPGDIVTFVAPVE
tara:strand:+ start:12647 stop:13381 length:735 start_codon:yes stop_codon:yes gene_type:complete